MTVSIDRARTTFPAPKKLLLAALVATIVAQSCVAFAGSVVRLPDTEVTGAGGYVAYLIDPTTRYDHGILGDKIEAGGLVVERNGTQLVYRLPDDAVFEDRRVRLADIDGDGVPEIIVVKSYISRGSAIAVYRIRDHSIVPFGESNAVGTAHRWLNPVGVADFTGSGEPMIAAVVTPHLAGSLRLYRLNGPDIVEVARIDGFTNHVAGTQNLDLSRLTDIDGDRVPEIVLPTVDRRSLAVVSFKGGRPRIVTRQAIDGQIVSLDPIRGKNASVGLSDGRRVAVMLR